MIKRNIKFLLSIMLLSVMLQSPVAVAQDDQTAPDFTLKSTAGEELTLYDFTGKVVILHFWKAN